MGNSLTIISKKEREELYKNLEGKWLIELDGRKMNDWDDFYYQIMPQIDFYEYSKKFEVSWHTVKDAALEFEVIEKYLQDNNYNEIAIVYKYPNFEMDNLERGYIYVSIVVLFLALWNNKIAKTTCYIVTEKLKKSMFVNNELKIATLEEKDDILRKNRGKEILEIDAKKIRKFEDLLEIFSNNMEKLERKNITIIISNFIDSLYHLDYEEVNLIIDELVEKLLLERGNKGKTVKIYGISDQNRKKHKIRKIKRYREKFDFLKRFKKVFSNRRKNNDLSDRVKKKNYFQNMIK